MKKILLLAALVVASLQLTAANVDLATAKQSAQRFLMSQTANGRLMASQPTITSTREVKNSSNVAQAAYYIVNTDRGYVIVAGDDRAREILAYGEGQLENLNDLPEAMQLFLNMYQKQMEYLQAHPGLKVQKAIYRGGVSVGPLLTTAWNQGKPYNMKTPKKGSGQDPYCKVGCSAVALAQVMRYWEYPKVSPALPGYTCPTSGYVIEDLPEYTFDWDNMRDSYPSSSSGIDQIPDAQIDAISWFMRYVGQAETMDYGLDRSGAEREEIMLALRTFGYRDAHVIEKWDFDDGTVNYTEEEWGELIQSELIAGRPLIYCAFDMSSDSTGIGGHAFNVDGYDAENDMYHVNFGMSADKNTYYALNGFTLDNGMTVYDFFPILFADVQDPTLTTDPHVYTSTDVLNMECYAGETTTATFNVTGAHLTGDITLALNDADGVFSMDVTTISINDLGTTVTVTYAPQEVGTNNATITLSSEGASDVTVELKGVATAAPLVVYAPVMQPAAEQYINLTSFRADWTDQTIPENVLSYTLDVKEKPGAGGLLAEVDWSNGPSSGNAESYLPEGWTYGDYSIFFDEGGVAITTDSYIRTDVLDFAGQDKVTVVMRAKNYYGWTASTITVKTSVDQKTLDLTNSYVDYTIVLNCAETDQIEFYADAWNPTIQAIKIYAGEVTPQMRATVEGDASHYVISGITEKTYTVNNLNAESTYFFKVKAHYADGTESEWSNIEQVTLKDNGTPAHDFEPGDVNHDNKLSIKDVTALINYLLSGDESVICTTCANVNGDEKVNIADVTALINLLLSHN